MRPGAGTASGTGGLVDCEVVVARADRVDAAGFEMIRSELPAERRARCAGYYRERDRYSSAVAFALLQQLWRERHPGRLPPVERARHGKPRFAAGPGVEFNLSHDAAVCVCALARRPVGVDVQSRIPFDADLFARIAGPAERGLRERCEHDDDLSGLWSRKEALIKRSGLGLSAVLPEVDTLAERSLVSFVSPELDVVFSLSLDGVTERSFAGRVRVRILEPAWDTAVASADAPAAGSPATGVRWWARSLPVTVSGYSCSATTAR
ncbi:MAG: 4'-phosphopantetheinyl transferase superfamily protein [Micropruina sp.]|uniref:4'-phosphopantetheinyl transferase family protein n=1 Tax=Micropruina sp. TaxID=2737536 RepID=UPI0039E37426